MRAQAANIFHGTQSGTAFCSSDMTETLSVRNYWVYTECEIGALNISIRGKWSALNLSINVRWKGKAKIVSVISPAIPLKLSHLIPRIDVHF